MNRETLSSLDVDDLGTLLQEARPRLLGYIDAISSRRISFIEAEDVVQETYSVVLARRCESEPLDVSSERLFRHLCCTARFLVKNIERRDAARKRAFEKNYVHRRSSELREKQTEVEHQNDREELSETVSLLLETLTQDLAVVVRLMYFDNLDVPTIAELLGVSDWTVYKRLQRARSQLRRILKVERK